MEGDESRQPGDIKQQGGDIAEAHEYLRVSLDELVVKDVTHPKSPVSAPCAENGIHLGIGEHLFQLPGSHFRRSGKLVLPGLVAFAPDKPVAGLLQDLTGPVQLFRFSPF